MSARPLAPRSNQKEPACTHHGRFTFEQKYLEKDCLVYVAEMTCVNRFLNLSYGNQMLSNERRYKESNY